MLKIKDNIDLKILCQYGFKRIRFLPLYEKIVYYDRNEIYSFIRYSINTKTRKIEIKTIDTHQHTGFIIDNTLYDLIKDDLIEKVDK